ncbi:MAG TPA: cytochrome c oxidase subunit II [Anaerolineales bacterium]
MGPFNFPLFPPEASTQAGQTDLLFVILILISGFFASIVVVLIVYWGLKYRRGKAADRSNPPLSNTKLEIGWMAGLLVLAMGTYTWATIMYYHITNPPKGAMEIYVTGRQWMWKFQHPEGQREIDVLHVPAGRDVRLIMTSEDVIHDFFVPAFRLKYDVIPGRYTNLWFNATKTGEYHLFCSQYCGTNHAWMAGTIIVMEPRDYAAWLSGAGQVAGAGAQAGGAALPPAQAGEQLFTQMGCASCHVSGAGTTAPSLNGLFGNPVTLADGSTVTADENYIRESILLPQRKIVAGYGPVMPSYQGRVTEDQLVQFVAYIKSLASSGGGAGATPGVAATPASGAATPGGAATPASGASPTP